MKQQKSPNPTFKPRRVHPRVLRLRRSVGLGPFLGRRGRVQLLSGDLEHLADGLDSVVRRLLDRCRRRPFTSTAASVDAAKLSQQILDAHVDDLVRDHPFQVELRDQAHGAQRALLDDPGGARVAGVVVVAGGGD